MKQISIKDELYINSRLQEIEIEKENIKKIYDYYFKIFVKNRVRDCRCSP